MTKTERLIERLEHIGREMAGRPGALALLGLGSVGKATHRLDEYSDLDFFAIVEPGYKRAFIDDLDWLASIQPIGYSFQNTPDGHKALYDDGIFCEFAVFEPHELPSIPFESGRLVWARDDFDAAQLEPAPRSAEFGARDEAFLLGELLTNLYVGLGRYARGEKLSACFFVQNYAVGRLLSLLEIWGESTGQNADSFSNERRFEERFGKHRTLIETLTPGYERSPAAARHMLEFLDTRVDLDAGIVAEIERLVAVCEAA